MAKQKTQTEAAPAVAEAAAAPVAPSAPARTWPCQCGVTFASFEALMEHYQKQPDHAAALPAAVTKKVTVTSMIVDAIKASATTPVTTGDVVKKITTTLTRTKQENVAYGLADYLDLLNALGLVEITGEQRDTFRLVTLQK